MVGILYESNEWSDWKLHAELEQALGEKVAMICMEDADAVEQAEASECLISRVFASAAFRGHKRSLQAMERFSQSPQARSIPVINDLQAHQYEVSKTRAADALARAGFDVPRIQATGTPDELLDAVPTWTYPLIVKPDCGGRTTYTVRAEEPSDAAEFLAAAPSLVYVVEDFVTARDGFMTRLELAGGRVVLAVKRSIAPSGLSSYHHGSSYALYPDCPSEVLVAAQSAAAVLGISYGSFDIIEAADGRNYFIDANSVSNVSEDCTELFQGLDLMKVYAASLAKDITVLRRAVQDTTAKEEHQC